MTDCYLKIVWDIIVVASTHTIGLKPTPLLRARRTCRKSESHAMRKSHATDIKTRGARLMQHLHSDHEISLRRSIGTKQTESQNTLGTAQSTGQSWANGEWQTHIAFLKDVSILVSTRKRLKNWDFGLRLLWCCTMFWFCLLLRKTFTSINIKNRKKKKRGNPVGTSFGSVARVRETTSLVYIYIYIFVWRVCA